MFEDFNKYWHKIYDNYSLNYGRVNGINYTAARFLYFMWGATILILSSVIN